MAIDISNVLQNAASKERGELAKAKIRIQDNRKRAKDTLKEGNMQKQKSGGVSKGGVLDTAAGNQASKTAQGLIKKGTENKDGKDKYNREFVVQFNPTSLQIRSIGGDDDIQITNYTASNIAGVKSGEVNLHVELSLKLIFDQLSITSSFVQELLNEGNGENKSSNKNATDNEEQKNRPSVQVIVDAFTATMRNENTRRLCFEWGEFYYEGIVRRMNTTYTMFDILGNPTRAEVAMTIYLVDEDSKETNDYWKDAYYAAFIEGNKTAEAMMKMGEKGLV